MAKIFRVATPDDIKIGMFGESNKQYRDLTTFDNNIHQLPNHDPLLKRKWTGLDDSRINYYFGCSSLQKIANWIDLEKLKINDSSNLSLYVIDISEDYVFHGTNQSIFLLNEMNYTEKYPLKKLLDFI